MKVKPDEYEVFVVSKEPYLWAFDAGRRETGNRSHGRNHGVNAVVSFFGIAISQCIRLY